MDELVDAIIAGANRPNAPSVLTQFIAVINTPFNFRKKIATNVENMKAMAARVQAYGISVDTPLQALCIFANMEMAVQHKWGRAFCPAVQALRKKNKYNFKHNHTL